MTTRDDNDIFNSAKDVQDFAGILEDKNDVHLIMEDLKYFATISEDYEDVYKTIGDIMEDDYDVPVKVGNDDGVHTTNCRRCSGFCYNHAFCLLSYRNNSY